MANTAVTVVTAVDGSQMALDHRSSLHSPLFTNLMYESLWEMVHKRPLTFGTSFPFVGVSDVVVSSTSA